MLATAVTTGSASADEAGSGCVTTGRELRYLVVFDRGTSRADAEAQIAAACGVPGGYYPQIAVGIAGSPDPGFGRRIGLDRAFSAQAERLATHRLNGSDAPKSAGARPRLSPVAPDAVPVADRTAEQWDMRSINASWPASVSPGSRDVVVGVLDSGVDPAHPDLAAAVEPKLSAGCLTGTPDTAEAAWAPTTSAHGTHVAGTIAAANDGRGVTGVAPGVRLASIKVIDDRGQVDPEAAVCGLMWAAAQHIEVANSSFTVGPSSLSCAPGDEHRVVHEAMARAVEYATAAGTLTVAAATNEAVNLTPSPRAGVRTPPRSKSCEASPAGLRDVVTVSAIGADEVKSGYSSYGLGVIDVTAPGGDTGGCVLSTVPGGYEPLCGTSMAAPHVAGVAALLASAHPGYGPRQLRRAIEQQARPMACPTDYDLTGDGHQDAYCAGYTGYNGFYGHGMVNALNALSPVRPGGRS
nr:S8 family serine peptidase [Amycolatopsis nigrescens]